MISINKARKILGKRYSYLTDDEMEILLSKTYLLADMAINLSDKKVFQNPPWFIDSLKEKKDDKAKG